VHVNPEPDRRPTANGQSVSTARNTAVVIACEGDDLDSDELTYEIVQGPQNGTLSVSAPDMAYQLRKNFTGADSFTFRVSDGYGWSSAATVSISVGSGGGTVSRAPAARNDSATLLAGQNSVTINVLANDSAPDGDPLTAPMARPRS
jgi:hypothetical protein